VATLVDPPLGITVERCVRGGWIPRPILAAIAGSPFVTPTFVVEECAAARAAPLLGGQRFERRHRVDLSSARPAGESRHACPLIAVVFDAAAPL